MKKGRFFILLCLFMVLITSVWAFDGGDGTAGDPFQISNVTHLQNMGGNLSANYILVNNVNASDTVNWNNGAGFIPVGNSSNSFSGSLNGQNFSIINLYINRSSGDTGLFGRLSGTVSDLVLENVSINGTSSVGSLVGSLRGATVNNVHTSGNVFSTANDAGGLAGDARTSVSTITRSSSSVTVVSTSGGGSVGGIIGFASHANIEECYSTGNVIGDDVLSIGGLVGSLQDSSSLNNSYSRSNVIGGDNNIGGLVGWKNNIPFSNSYSTGLISSDGINIGGLIGYNASGTVNNSFWDINTSGVETSNGGTGKTTTEMKSQTTFTDTDTDGLNVAWDFDNIWGSYYNLNDGYPYLQSLNVISVNSCQNLTSTNTVYTLTQNVSSNDTCFRILAENITLDGAGYTINYGSSARGYAVGNGDELFSSEYYNNLTIINVNINQSSDDFSSSHAIYTKGNYTLIANSTITTWGSVGHPIYFGTNSDYGRVESNNITTNGTSSYGIHSYTGSDNHTIINNNLNVSFSGMQLFGDNNIIENNTLSGINPAATGISLTGDSNQIINNNITFSGFFGLSLYFSSSENNVVYRNIFNSTQWRAISLSNSGNITLSNNTIVDNQQFQFYTSSLGTKKIVLSDQNILNYSITDWINFTIENTTFGKIDFTSPINGTGSTLFGYDGADIIITNNSVYVNSSRISGLNKTANVTLYGIGNRGFAHPAILKDGDLCTDCYNFTPLTAEDVKFNVSSWSNYSIGEDPSYIDSCQPLNVTGRYYILTQNVTSNDTCFPIAADGVTLDGAGFTINYTLSYNGLAFNNSVPYNNITIQNLVIISTNSSAISQGIFSKGNNITIMNNTFNISSGNAILFSDVNNASINNNTIINNGGGYGIYSLGSQYVNVEGNNITTNGYGLDIEGKNYAILNNDVFSFDSGALFFRSNSSTISNNNFTSIDPGSFSLIYLSNPSYNNLFSNNKLNSTTGSVFFTRVTNNGNNTFTQNIIIDNGLNDLFIEFNNVNGNNIKDQKIRKYNLSNTGSKIIIENTTYGKIEFTSGINGSGNNLIGNTSSDIIFGDVSVFVNSSRNEGLNRSANVTFYNVASKGFNNPIITKDGVECTDCYAFTSLTADTVIFNVTSWSNYSIEEGPAITNSGGGSHNNGNLNLSIINECENQDIEIQIKSLTDKMFNSAEIHIYKNKIKNSNLINKFSIKEPTSKLVKELTTILNPLNSGEYIILVKSSGFNDLEKDFEVNICNKTKEQTSENKKINEENSEVEKIQLDNMIYSGDTVEEKSEKKKDKLLFSVLCIISLIILLTFIYMNRPELLSILKKETKRIKTIWFGK